MPTKRVHTLAFRHALNRATLSLREVASGMGVSQVTLQQYRKASAPSDRMAIKLRVWLDQYSRELAEIAKRLPKEKR